MFTIWTFFFFFKINIKKKKKKKKKRKKKKREDVLKVMLRAPQGHGHAFLSVWFHTFPTSRMNSIDNIYRIFQACKEINRRRKTENKNIIK
jgi:hypothetical protein